MVSSKKILKVLSKYEKGAVSQMKECGGLVEADSVESEESLHNFQIVGATVQFMTIRDIAKDLGLLEDLMAVTMEEE